MKHISYFFAIFLLLLYSCEEESKRPFGTLIEVPNEIETIKDAISIAQPHDTVLIHNGEYFEWNIKIEKPIYITSNYFYENDSNIIAQTIINANHESRVFTIMDISDVLFINGITMRNGATYFGGGLYCENSSINISNVVIESNSASKPNSQGAGGGLFLKNSNIILDNVHIYDNYGLRTGGAFYCENSTLKVINSLIDNNESWWGGPPVSIWLSTINFKNVIFRDNLNSFTHEDYPEIIIAESTGVLENVQVVNDSISIGTSTIDLINCRIPGY